MELKKSCSFSKFQIKENADFYPFLDFYDGNYLGILAGDYDIDDFKENDSVKILTGEYCFHTGLSGCTDWQPIITIGGIEYKLPFSWHITCGHNLWGKVIHLAIVKDLTGGIQKPCGLFRIKPFVARIMGWIAKKLTNDWFGVVEHGIPYRLSLIHI